MEAEEDGGALGGNIHRRVSVGVWRSKRSKGNELKTVCISFCPWGFCNPSFADAKSTKCSNYDFRSPCPSTLSGK